MRNKDQLQLLLKRGTMNTMMISDCSSSDRLNPLRPDRDYYISPQFSFELQVTLMSKSLIKSLTDT